MEDSEFLTWFAGFAAGEGCFNLRTPRPDNYWTAAFAIHLRDDDLPILLEIQERLQMGTMTRKRAQPPGRPSAGWQVARIADCIRLVEIFNQHPLRGKKQADFEVWKQAVEIINRGRSKGGSTPVRYDCAKLQYLSDRLKFTRAYMSPDEDKEASGDFDREDSLQLAIWEEEEELGQ